MTKDSPKAEQTKGQDKVDPAAVQTDVQTDTPRPAPRWKPDQAVDEEDDDLFNDMPV
jgi:hypothetical protein